MSDELIRCRVCGIDRPWDDYRFFSIRPEKSYMDFCMHCEKREGTIALYRRFHAYATKEIAEAVFAAERLPEAKRSEDQVRLLVSAQSIQEPTSNEEVLKRELARREFARRRFIFFIRTFQSQSEPYKPNWVHQDLCRRLEKFVQDVEKGLSPRLMIAMPPRHGKSLHASDMFPSWVLGRHPEWGIIGASYAQTLPADFSRNIRDRIRDPEYQAIFPDTQLRKDSTAVESWKTTKGGGYIAAGVGVGINGKGMHIGIADDLLKDAEAASSELQRDAAYAWYLSVFRLRLAPGGGILLIGTRWHDLDVQGKELSKEEQLRKQGVPEEELEGWDVISYPALANKDEYLLSDGSIWEGDPPEDEITPRLLRKKGEALHPERYDAAALKKIQHIQGPQLWSALYQQNPTPDDGEFFKRGDFRYGYLPQDYWADCRRFITMDFAIGKRTSSKDWTVGGAWLLDRDDDLHCIKVVRGRWNTMEIVREILGLVQIPGFDPEFFAGERGQIYESIWPIVRAELDKLRIYLPFDETLVPIQDKEMRARPLQGRTQRKKLVFSYEGTRPEEQDNVEKELLRFPNGTNDDIVDMMAWAARLAVTLSLPTVGTPAALKSWKDRYSNPGGDRSHMAA